MSLSETREIVKHGTLTHDAFLGGRLTIGQPARGFRAGLDSVLLGAAVGVTSGGLLDLGAGAGTAGLVALATHPALAATLIEQDAEMAGLARTNIASNGLAPRASVVTGDLTAPGAQRAQWGLSPDHFAAVIANPPFYTDGTLASPARRDARQMPADTLDRWAAVAASHAAPGGEVIFIHLADVLPQLLASLTARFGAVTVLPLLPRAGAPAHRVLVRGIKGSRAPFRLLAARPLHTDQGRTFQPDIEAILRGADRLHW